MSNINWNANKTDEEARESMIERLSIARKEVEAEGVVLNGIRYAGNPENRQALDEAVRMATKLGTTTFPSWKDSDNKFFAEVPVADVEAALLQIGQKRQELIAKEGEFTAKIMDGTLTNVLNLDWSTTQPATQR